MLHRDIKQEIQDVKELLSLLDEKIANLTQQIDKFKRLRADAAEELRKLDDKKGESHA